MKTPHRPVDDRLDYDPVSVVYDRRYETGGPVGIAESLRRVARSVDARTVVEIGCGTGHWLARWEDTVWTCGLDVSAGMLGKARDKLHDGALVRADAHRIPLKDDSLDFAYCVNALHHFETPATAIAEAARIVHASGAVAVVGMDPSAGRDRWYLYDFFPGTLETDLRRYPSGSRIEQWMTQTGLSCITHRAVARIHRSARGEEVFADPVLHKHGTSQLALLSEEEYETGIERIRSRIARNSDFEFSIDVTLYMTAGFGPESPTAVVGPK